MTATATIKKLEDQGLTMHHSARARKYVSRKNDACLIEEYCGRFGKGYKVFTPAWDSTQYCWVTYYTH